MDSFYVHLPSNVRNQYFENTISNYRTKLPRKLNLDNDWEVALSSISFIKSWHEVPHTMYYYCQSLFGKYPKLFIESGDYTIEELISKINTDAAQQAAEIMKTVDTSILTPILSYNNIQKRVSHAPGALTTKAEISNMRGIINFKFDEPLSHMLGLTSKYEKADSNIIKDTTIDMKAGFHSIYIYSDIVKPSIVGDTFSQLLRVFQVGTTKFGEPVELNFNTLHYIPINKNEIDSIEIDIKDDLGRNIPFTFGRSIAVLHFRKRNEFS